ncbi:MAG: LuxR C-terminal-related transcriptional regulator [Flavobacteriaceae bacterium]
MENSDTENAWKENIIHYHLNQPYGDLDAGLNVDNILEKYHLFPNEALYIIDCKQAQLEAVSKNFYKLIGIERKNKNDISLLYDHVDGSNGSALHHWVMTNIKTSFRSSSGVQVEKDIYKCMYKTYQGKILLKSTTGLIYDSLGILRYTLGKLTDLTGLVAFDHFGYEYDGPNKDKFYEMYKTGLDHECVLTKREKEILDLLSEGFTSRVIASKLFISVHTVDTHRRNIIEKMETKTAMEAYKKCKNSGWL